MTDSKKRDYIELLKLRNDIALRVKLATQNHRPVAALRHWLQQVTHTLLSMELQTE